MFRKHLFQTRSVCSAHWWRRKIPCECDVLLMWNCYQKSICYNDGECLHQLLTRYKQGYADFCIWEDGIMRSVAPHVRLESNFNLEGSKFSA